MADKAHPCPCTDPKLPQFHWVSTVDPIAGRVLKALHTGILTGEECSECASKKWDWHNHAAILIATKTTDDVQRALDVVRQQSPIAVNVKELARLLRVLSTLYQEKMLTEQEMEELKPPVWNCLVQIQCTKPLDVVKRTTELLAEVGHDKERKQLKVLSTLYQGIMVTEQEMEELKQVVWLWDCLVHILCARPPDVVKRMAELLAEVGHDEEGKLLKVFTALYQKKVIAQHDLLKWTGSAWKMHLDLICDLCTRPSEDVATTADVLDMVGWKEKAEMLRVLSVLYQKKVLAHHEVVEMHHEVERHRQRQSRLWRVVGPEEKYEEDLTIKEALWQGLISVQCWKPPEVVTTTAEVLNKVGLKEEATQLRVLSELYQKGLISEDDLRCLSHHRYMMRYSSRHRPEYSSRHWLDSLVDIQSSKSDDVYARTFDTLRRYSLTEVGKVRQTKPTGLETSEKLPSSSTKRILQEWGRLPKHLLSKESQLLSTPKELSVSPTKTEISSLQSGGGSDPPEREDASNLLTDEDTLKRLCWIPFGIKTVTLNAEGGIICLHTLSNKLQWMKDDTIFVEVPPDAVNTSANVKMRYAIILSGPFTLPKGYQFGSPVVYIYYDGRRVTKPLTLKIPHWYGGTSHARDGLSFAIAPHSLKRGATAYQFQFIRGSTFPKHQQYGILHIDGHSSLIAEVFKEKATSLYLATQWEQRLARESHTKFAITYYSAVWMEEPLEEKLKQLNWERNEVIAFPFLFKKSWLPCCYKYKVCVELSEKESAGPGWTASVVGANAVYQDEVACHDQYTQGKLECLVSNGLYPPAIHCVVTYKYAPDFEVIDRVLNVKMIGTDKPKVSFPVKVYSAKATQASPTQDMLSEPLNSPPGMAGNPSVSVPHNEASTRASPLRTLTPAQSNTAQSSISPRPAAAEFLDHFRQQFIAEVDASTIVLELEHRDIISNGDQKTISRKEDNTQQSQLLHACLKKTCDAKALTDVCDIIATVKGNPRMKSFGERMKTEWEKVSQKPSRQAPPTGPQSGDSL